MYNVKSFKEFISINENSNSNLYYHRSIIKYKKGEKIKKRVNKASYEELLEFLFEKVRPTNKPSRLNCVYSSISPNNRFTSIGGYLYKVKPIGKVHITNSMIYDQVFQKINNFLLKKQEYAKAVERWGMYAIYNAKNINSIVEKIINENKDIKSLLEKYWKDGNTSNTENIEILSDDAIVEEEYNVNKRYVYEGAAVRINNDNIFWIHNNGLASLNIFRIKFKKLKEEVGSGSIIKLINYKDKLHIDYAELPNTFNTAYEKRIKLKLDEFNTAYSIIHFKLIKGIFDIDLMWNINFYDKYYGYTLNKKNIPEKFITTILQK